MLQLAAVMQTIMLERSGVGIAAPQVYISKRVIIVASRPNPRYPDAPDMAAVVMVNPEILEFSKTTCFGEEGCLNVPNERGQVERAQVVKVRYYTHRVKWLKPATRVFLRGLCNMKLIIWMGFCLWSGFNYDSPKPSFLQEGFILLCINLTNITCNLFYLWIDSCLRDP